MSEIDDTSAKLARAAKERGDTPVHPAVGERIWKNVEAGIAAPPPRFWQRPRLVLGAVAAAAVLTIAVLVQPKDERPQLVAGAAFMLDGGKALRVNEPMQFATKVVAADDGATFEQGAARVVVSKATVLIFLARDHHALKNGSALYEISPDGVGFGLTMGPWEVRVTGTRFWVMQSLRENVIEVYEGSVKLKTGSREIELRAGDSFREFLGPTSMATEPSAPATLPTAPAPTPPPPKEPTLAEALGRVRAGKYKEAEQMYRRIAEHTPAQAEVALYALAKMKLQKSGEIDAGLALLDELDRAHPKGALRQERMLTRIEALFRHARCEQAKAAVAAYVKEYTHAIDSLREIDASQCAK